MRETSQNDKWLNVVRDKMKDYSEPLPYDDWDGIEKELSQNPKRSRVLYLKSRFILSAAVIAVLIGVSCALYYFYPSSPSSDSYISANHPIARMEKHSEQISAKNDNRVATHLLSRTEQSPIRASTYQSESEKQKKSDELLDTVTKFGARSADKVSERPAKDVALNNHHQVARQNYHSDDEAMPTYTSLNTKKENGWSVLLAMGTSAGGMSTQGGAGEMASSSYDLFNGKDLTSSSESMGLGRSGVKLKHRPPLRIGLMVSKFVSRRISLQTGLTYTYLLSVPADEHLGSDFNQQIYYVGIPLKVNYHFYKGRKFSTYWSNGIEAEKCIYAKRGDTKLTINKIQWSVNTSLGAQYKIAPQIAVFAEPGFSYYWDKEKGVETFRTEHPLNFNIHFGLKLTY